MLAAILGIVLLLQLGSVHAEPVPVRYAEGVTHGFLVLRTLQGKDVADGDLGQVVHGDRVSRRLVFHFKDGSIQDESVVFSQRGTFRLLSDRLVQKGPAFPHPIDVTIDGVSGQVKVRYTDDDGKEKLANERLALPADVANGLLPTLLRNVPRGVPSMTVSLVAATPEPKLMKLEVSPEGEDTFSIGGLKLKGGAGSGPLFFKNDGLVLGGGGLFFLKEGGFFWGGGFWKGSPSVGASLLGGVAASGLN